MELLNKISLVEVLAFITLVTAVSKLFEALLNVNGPATILIRWLIRLSKAVSTIEEIKNDQAEMKAEQAEMKIEQAEMKTSLEFVKHEVQTNSGSSLKDAVKRGEIVNDEILDLAKQNASDMHVFKQKFANEEKYSSSLRFTITPSGISKSNHAAKALFGYSEAEAGASVSWQNSIPFQQRKSVLEQWNYAWQNKATFESDFYILHSDRNRAFYVHVEAVPICDLDGRLLMHDGSMVVLEKDISIDDLKRRLREDVQF